MSAEQKMLCASYDPGCVRARADFYVRNWDTSQNGVLSAHERRPKYCSQKTITIYFFVTS